MSLGSAPKRRANILKTAKITADANKRTTQSTNVSTKPAATGTKPLSPPQRPEILPATYPQRKVATNRRTVTKKEAVKGSSAALPFDVASSKRSAV
jgi:hypothetical protein